MYMTVSITKFDINDSMAGEPRVILFLKVPAGFVSLEFLGLAGLFWWLRYTYQGYKAGGSAEEDENAKRPDIYPQQRQILYPSRSISPSLLLLLCSLYDRLNSPVNYGQTRTNQLLTTQQLSYFSRFFVFRGQTTIFFVGGNIGRNLNWKKKCWINNWIKILNKYLIYIFKHRKFLLSIFWFFWTAEFKFGRIVNI